MTLKSITLRSLLSKRLPKDIADKYLERIGGAMFGQRCRLVPDNLEKEVKELGEALLAPKEYTLENIGLTLSVLGLTLLNNNYKEEE